MKHLVVRKKKSHRIGIRCFAVLGSLTFFLLLCLTNDFLLSLLIFMLTQSPMALLLFYYESWAIVFCRDKILKRCWGHTRGYDWTDIQEVSSYRSATEGPYILIRFRDGKMLRFRIEDENGAKAVGLIMKHTSIRSL